MHRSLAAKISAYERAMSELTEASLASLGAEHTLADDALPNLEDKFASAVRANERSAQVGSGYARGEVWWSAKGRMLNV